mmetsp:Transcript_14512/g.61124  ORF Transcript_14512/g.61124 Transcript_14512/m.61124 type:complete len:209 (-) Transcript_14512:1426-2052(-)
MSAAAAAVSAIARRISGGSERRFSFSFSFSFGSADAAGAPRGTLDEIGSFATDAFASSETSRRESSNERDPPSNSPTTSSLSILPAVSSVFSVFTAAAGASSRHAASSVRSVASLSSASAARRFGRSLVSAPRTRSPPRPSARVAARRTKPHASDKRDAAASSSTFLKTATSAASNGSTIFPCFGGKVASFVFVSSFGVHTIEAPGSG